jgi:hypothetical protein
VPTHQETKKMSDSDLPHADDDKCLRDFEVALMDTTKTVFEIMLNAGATPAQIDKLLASQQTAYEKNGAMPAGREEHREQVRRILGEPPAGSA